MLLGMVSSRNSTSVRATRAIVSAAMCSVSIWELSKVQAVSRIAESTVELVRMET
jgi:hypothetical protein